MMTKFQAFAKLYEELFPFEDLAPPALVPPGRADQEIHKFVSGVFRRFRRTIYKSQYGGLSKLECDSVSDAKHTMRLIERYFE
jgi:hypothetical protein